MVKLKKFTIMNYIESTKSYTDSELETVFFKPMLTGASAEDLGIRVLYNMPVPTTIHLWEGKNSILQAYTAAGWKSGDANTRTQKTIDMRRVKAEMGFSAADYFSLVFENLATNADINGLEDLTGTELEAAETELFRRSIAESIRITMWAGDVNLVQGINSFTGFLKLIDKGISSGTISEEEFTMGSNSNPEYTKTLFAMLWDNASDTLKNSKNNGQLAIFVSSDIYTHYEMALDEVGVDGAYVDSQSGRQKLMYHGIEVIDIRVPSSILIALGVKNPFAILTDRRNLVMAINTADFPGSECRMWYNPDEMENRQRAIFAAGCSIIDESSLVYAIGV